MTLGAMQRVSGRYGTCVSAQSKSPHRRRLRLCPSARGTGEPSEYGTRQNQQHQQQQQQVQQGSMRSGSMAMGTSEEEQGEPAAQLVATTSRCDHLYFPCPVPRATHYALVGNGLRAAVGA